MKQYPYLFKNFLHLFRKGTSEGYGMLANNVIGRDSFLNPYITLWPDHPVPPYLTPSYRFLYTSSSITSAETITVFFMVTSLFSCFQRVSDLSMSCESPHGYHLLFRVVPTTFWLTCRIFNPILISMLDTFFLVIFRSVQRHLDFSVSHIDSFLPQ